MSKKTYRITAIIWFALVLIVIAASFLPIVDAGTQETIRKYLAWVVLVGALAMIMLRSKVEDDK